MILASTSTLFSFSVAIPKICGSGSCRTSLLPGDPVSPVWRQSVVSWQLCHNSITSHSIHSFISLPDVIGPFFVCSTVTVNGNFNSLLPMLAETRTNKTVKSRANLLLSLADQPLLGDASLNVGHLWYFRETPSLHLLLVLQQMQGLSSVGHRLSHHWTDLQLTHPEEHACRANITVRMRNIILHFLDTANSNTLMERQQFVTNM